MAYEKVFESSYPNGWKDQPDKSTPAYASTFDGYDEAIEHIEDFLDGSTAVKPVAKTEAMTQAVGADPSTGALYTTPGGGGGSSEAEDINYDNTESGLESDNVQGAIDELAAGAGNKITPVEKTEDMTQEVGWDSETGELWTLPGQAIQELQLKGTWTKLLDVREESSQTKDSYNLKDSIFNYDTIVVHVYYIYQSKYIINSITIPTSQVILGDTTAWYIAGATNNDAMIIFNSEGTTITKKTQSGTTYIFAVYGYNGGSMSIAGDYSETILFNADTQASSNTQMVLTSSIKNFESLRIKAYQLDSSKKIRTNIDYSVSDLSYGNADDCIWCTVASSTAGYFYFNAEGDAIIWLSVVGTLYIDEIVGIKKKVYAPVVDGLVRWYDGINNTGAGHTDTTTTWKDLTNTGDATIASGGGGGWLSNAFCAGDVQNGFRINGFTYDGTYSITMEVYINRLVYSDATLIGSVGNSRDLRILSEGASSIKANFRDTSVKQVVYTIDSKDKDKKLLLSLTYNINTKQGALYVNGELIGEVTLDSHPTTSNDFYVGASSDYPTTYYFRGLIYDARIYNRVLTAEEIQQNYQYDLHRFSGLAE